MEKSPPILKKHLLIALSHKRGLCVGDHIHVPQSGQYSQQDIYGVRVCLYYFHFGITLTSHKILCK